MSKNFDKRTEVSIDLEFPVEIDGTKYEKLTIRRPKAGDGLAAANFKGNEAAKGIFLFARLCNVAPNVIEALDEVDSDALGRQYAAFTGRQSE